MYTGLAAPDPTWVDSPSGVCLSLRPDRSDDNGVVLSTVLSPSAETRFETQVYVPEVYSAPIVYGVLIDLEIPNDMRCEQVKTWLEDQIDSAFQARGDVQQLGIYTPMSSNTLEPLTGCEQESNQDYPVETMLADARRAHAMIEPNAVRVVWVYVNNVDLPPSERLLDRVVQLGAALEFDDGLEKYTWAIGSNGIIGSDQEETIPIGEDAGFPIDPSEFPSRAWDFTTGWRPIEDDTFRADLRSFARNVLPFKTMLHDDSTPVPITSPSGRVPERFKLCQTTPVAYFGITIPSSNAIYGPLSTSLPWPNESEPSYSVELGEQYLVASDDFADLRVSAVVEFCDRFCPARFQTLGGARFDSWQQTGMEVCQWQQ